MSLLPRQGTCFHCGHDHGEGYGSPRELELISRIAELEQQLRNAEYVKKMVSDHRDELEHQLEAQRLLSKVHLPPKADCGRCVELERQLAAMRASFHVNMLRAFPTKSHEDIAAEIDRAAGSGSQPTAQQVEDARDAAIGRFLMQRATQNSEISWPRLHSIKWSGYAVTNEGDGYRNWTLREALEDEIAAMQAGKEPKECGS